MPPEEAAMLDHSAGVRGSFRGHSARLGVAVALFCLAVVAALGVTVPQASSDAGICSRVYHKPPTGNAGPGPAPLLIGDSVVGFAMPELQRIGYRINGQGCRTFARGITALKREARKRSLPDLVVFELGTAGKANLGMIEKVLAILGPDRRLGLVTPRVFLGGVDLDAAIYHAAAALDPRVTVIEWAEQFGVTPGVVPPRPRAPERTRGKGLYQDDEVGPPMKRAAVVSVLLAAVAFSRLPPMPHAAGSSRSSRVATAIWAGRRSRSARRTCCSRSTTSQTPASGRTPAAAASTRRRLRCCAIYGSRTSFRGSSSSTSAATER